MNNKLYDDTHSYCNDTMFHSFHFCVDFVRRFAWLVVVVVRKQEGHAAITRCTVDLITSRRASMFVNG